MNRIQCRLCSHISSCPCHSRLQSRLQIRCRRHHLIPFPRRRLLMPWQVSSYSTQYSMTRGLILECTSSVFLILPLVMVTDVKLTHTILFAVDVSSYRLFYAVSPHCCACSLYSINSFSSSSVTGLNHFSVSTSTELDASSCPRGTLTTLYRTLLNASSLF